MTHEPQRALTYIELDVQVCTLTYGVSPCEAELGVTGAIKCFNTVASCQDRENIDLTTATLRFAKPADYLPKEIPAIPSISDVSVTPATVSLGEDLGERGTLEIRFKDHPHSDVGFDPYVDERPYNPFQQGSFFGKFRARQPFVRGKSIRLIRGFLGQSLEEMETRHYVVESFDGPTPQGEYRLLAKDILKLLSGDRAQAPYVSQGFLATGIDEDDLAATLAPAGIGNAEYPASGWLAIGGKEVVAFTRSADAITITARGEFGTTAVSHAQEDRVQVVLVYESEDVADILNDLLTNYAGVDPAYIPLDAWQTETASFINNVYSASIAQPTSVEKLCSEIIEQAGLAI